MALGSIYLVYRGATRLKCDTEPPDSGITRVTMAPQSVVH
jgi:hypothetical protein